MFEFFHNVHLFQTAYSYAAYDKEAAFASTLVVHHLCVHTGNSLYPERRGMVLSLQHTMGEGNRSRVARFVRSKLLQLSATCTTSKSEFSTHCIAIFFSQGYCP